jgi:hypothetical protein
MYYTKAVNCCAALRALLDGGADGGDCPPAPAAPCRGFSGDCADLAAQFAAVAVLPDYPDGLADWTCTAFPNDNAPSDSLIVGLISIAVSLPVALFLRGCFALANDSEAPESFLTWSGWRKLFFGFAAHRRWHYTGPEGQPCRYVRWHVRSGEEPPLITLVNLGRAAATALTRTPPPWVLEARAAEAAAAAEEEDEGGEAASSAGGMGEASFLSRFKRALMAAGLLGTYLCWAIMTWFIFTCARAR